MTGHTRRTFIQGGIGAVAALYLAGCGSSDKTASSVDVLYDWTYNGPPGQVAKYWRQIRTRLAQADNGAALGQLKEVPFEALYQTVPASIKARSGPSLATWYADFATYNLASAEDIAPLAAYVGGSEPDHWLLASTKSNGKYYGAPLVLEIAVLAVNRKHFETAGIDVEGTFASYDVFIDACDRLKAAGITPIQVGTSDGVGAEKWLMFEQLQVCESPADLLRGVVGELSLDAPVFARPRVAIPALRDKYMNSNPQNDTDQMAVDKFLAGEAGMTLTYTSPVFAEGIGAEFEIVGFPSSGAKFNRPAIGTGDTLMIMDYADNKEVAGSVIDFMHEPEQLALWWDLTRSLPADDRFDASTLPVQGKQIWDLILERKDDIYALWWPDNFYPPSVALPFIGIQQELFSGAADPAEAKAKTEALFASFRKNNPSEVETVKSYIETLDELSS